MKKPPLEATFSAPLRGSGSTQVYCVHGRWSLNLYSAHGDIVFPQSGERWALRPGMALLMPPGTVRQFVFTTPGRHRVVHFAVDAEVRGNMPELWRCGRHRAVLERLFDEAQGAEEKPRQLAVLWYLLWRLIESQETRAETGGAALHPALQKAVHYIATHLSESLTARDIVAVTGFSHNHVTRLFGSAFGTTIMGYIRAQRMALAKDLLLETDMPVKAVAGEVGIPDAQRFNKTVRRHFGESPSALRLRLSVERHE